jgi:hypothetical protein
MVLEGFNEQSRSQMGVGLLRSAKKLNSVLMSERIEGVILALGEQSHFL